MVSVEEVTKIFPANRRSLFPSGKAGSVTAVDRVSLSVADNEIVALIGESGCGKTTLGKIMLGIIPASDGKVLFDGHRLEEFTSSGRKEYMDWRRRYQMVFQDPYSSLNPRLTVRQTLAEPFILHTGLDTASVRLKVDELIWAVGLDSGVDSCLPGELSGGQRQRVNIARALACQPRFIVCDEPLATLDASVKSQIVNLLVGIHRQYGVSYLFISHDLPAARYIADRVAVMYRGSLVETAPTELFFNRPRHPYSQILLANSHQRYRDGRLSDPSVPITHQPGSTGCKFAGQCPRAAAVCFSAQPLLIQTEPDSFLACHLPPG
ncbi:MAG: ATP-binding cassette domain-containing protein [Negativicutes bacterium]|nr:ATP-binding cassette domain-containing protein [Negativicutes bacterium]